MKRIFALPVIFLSLTGLAQFASAGPERYEGKESTVQPVVEQECKWTGFYIGIQGGYGGGNLRWTQKDSASSKEQVIIEHQQEGFFGGGELGYNFQFGWFVVGAEGDFSYSDVNAHTVNDQFTPNTTVNDTGLDWIGTGALRVGVACHRALFFAKGGVSFANVTYLASRGDFTDSEETPHTDRFSTDEVRGAPMVGGGVEYALTCHWSAKVEYKHVFFDDYKISGITSEVPTPERDNYRIDLQHNALAVGLNYKF